jgi:tRNA dimethylallyltransferase
MIPIITVEGPTASGKSRVAMEIAQLLKTEIISADSRQIYRYLDIGTAKPSPEQRAKIKHHLIDVVDPDQDYSAGRFAQESTFLVKKLWADKKLPIVAGGTGFYVKSLLEGLFESPPVAENIRRELALLEEEKGSDYLHKLLEKVDPSSAERIHSNDSYRVKRALEVWIATGKSISKHWDEQKKNNSEIVSFRVMVQQDRDQLYERIEKRMEEMIEKGLIDEIRKLFEMGYQESDPGMSSVGYKEFLPFIKGEATFLSCLEEAKKDTRNYAKRQLTWYRRIHFDYYTTIEEFSGKQLVEVLKKYFARSGYHIILDTK